MPEDTIISLEDVWSDVSRDLEAVGVIDADSYGIGVREYPLGTPSLAFIARAREIDQPTLQWAHAFQVQDSDWSTVQVSFSALAPPWLNNKLPEKSLTAFYNSCEDWRDDNRLCAEGYLDLGCAYFWLGKFQDAKRAWNESLKLNPASTTKESLEHNIRQLPPVPIPMDRLLSLRPRVAQTLLQRLDNIREGLVKNFFLVD